MSYHFYSFDLKPNQLVVWLQTCCVTNYTSQWKKLKRNMRIEKMLFHWCLNGEFHFTNCSPCRNHSSFVNCVRFSPDGSKFITTGSDKKGFIYSGQTGEKIGEFLPENGHAGSIYAASWSSDGKQVTTPPYIFFCAGMVALILFFFLNVTSTVAYMVQKWITQSCNLRPRV